MGLFGSHTARLAREMRGICASMSAHDDARPDGPHSVRLRASVDKYMDTKAPPDAATRDARVEKILTLPGQAQQQEHSLLACLNHMSETCLRRHVARMVRDLSDSVPTHRQTCAGHKPTFLCALVCGRPDVFGAHTQGCVEAVVAARNQSPTARAEIFIKALKHPARDLRDAHVTAWVQSLLRQALQDVLQQAPALYADLPALAAHVRPLRDASTELSADLGPEAAPLQAALGAWRPETHMLSVLARLRELETAPGILALGALWGADFSGAGDSAKNQGLEVLRRSDHDLTAPTLCHMGRVNLMLEAGPPALSQAADFIACVQAGLTALATADGAHFTALHSVLASLWPTPADETAVMALTARQTTLARLAAALPPAAVSTLALYLQQNELLPALAAALHSHAPAALPSWRALLRPQCLAAAADIARLAAAARLAGAAGELIAQARRLQDLALLAGPLPAPLLALQAWRPDVPWLRTLERLATEAPSAKARQRLHALMELGGPADPSRRFAAAESPTRAAQHESPRPAAAARRPADEAALLALEGALRRLTQAPPSLTVRLLDADNLEVATALLLSVSGLPPENLGLLAQALQPHISPAEACRLWDSARLPLWSAPTGRAAWMRWWPTGMAAANTRLLTYARDCLRAADLKALQALHTLVTTWPPVAVALPHDLGGLKTWRPNAPGPQLLARALTSPAFNLPGPLKMLPWLAAPARCEGPTSALHEAMAAGLPQDVRVRMTCQGHSLVVDSTGYVSREAAVSAAMQAFYDALAAHHRKPAHLDVLGALVACLPVRPKALVDFMATLNDPAPLQEISQWLALRSQTADGGAWSLSAWINRLSPGAAAESVLALAHYAQLSPHAGLPEALRDPRTDNVWQAPRVEPDGQVGTATRCGLALWRSTVPDKLMTALCAAWSLGQHESLLDLLRSTALCPITGTIMHDPVRDPAGHTYERAAIAAWLKLFGTSPITEAPLRAAALVPHRPLQALLKAAAVAPFDQAAVVESCQADLDRDCRSLPLRAVTLASQMYSPADGAASRALRAAQALLEHCVYSAPADDALCAASGAVRARAKRIDATHLLLPVPLAALTAAQRALLGVLPGQELNVQLHYHGPVGAPPHFQITSGTQFLGGSTGAHGWLALEAPRTHGNVLAISHARLRVAFQLSQVLARVIEGAHQSETQTSLLDALDETLTQRLTTLSQHCCVCDVQLAYHPKRPSPCAQATCHAALAASGSTLALSDMVWDPAAARLRVHSAWTAAHDEKVSLLLDGAPMQHTALIDILQTLPNIQTLQAWQNPAAQLQQMHPQLPATLQWLGQTPQDYVRRVQLHYPGWDVFQVVAVDGAKAWETQRRAGGTRILFHGTVPARLHAILSRGLRSMSGTTLQRSGASYGQGVYFAAQSSGSVGYSQAVSPCPPMNWAMPVGTRYVLACEVLADAHFLKNDDIVVLPDADKAAVRFVFHSTQTNPPAIDAAQIHRDLHALAVT